MSGDAEWISVALGEHCKIKTGKKDVNEGNPFGQFPFFTCSRDVTWSDEYSFDTEAILIAGNGEVGNLHYYNGKFEAYQRTYVLDGFTINIDYVYQYLAGNLLKSLEKEKVGTSIPYIKLNNLTEFEIHIPKTLRYQSKIALILQTIDQAIEKTEALIHKYQQIKAGLMHDLFTRGLTADGKLRPPREQAPELYQETPIGWIPKEWVFSICSKVCEKIIDCKNRTPPITLDGFPVIRTPNVRDGEFVDKELVYTDYNSYLIWTARGKPVVGDIVITREAPVGEVCMIPKRHPHACLGQRMMLYRPDVEVIDPQYFLYVLQSQAIQNRLDLISGGSTVGHVRVGDIRDLWIFYPESSEEQRKIGVILGSTTKNIASERAKEDKLKQQKIGLMHDLLTGKVPVKLDQEEPAHG